jgi:hypothetical protein
VALDNQDWSTAGNTGGRTLTQTVTKSTTGASIAVGGATMLLINSSGNAGSIANVSGSVDGVSWGTFRVEMLDSNGVHEVFNMAANGAWWVTVAGFQFVRFQEIGGAADFVLTAIALFGPWQLPTIGLHDMLHSLSVAIASDQTPLLGGLGNGVTSADTVLSAPFAVALAASASLVLVAGIAFQKVYCLELNLFVVTAAVTLAQLQDTGGALLADIRTDAIMPQPRSLRGITSALGNGVRLTNTNGAGATGTMAGELIYVQK